MSGLIVGKVAITLVAVFGGVAPFFADWNETHIRNPRWPPHAKFHNAQTMVLGAVCALLAVWFLWWPGPAPRLRLDVGSAFAGLYWACLVPSILFPGTAFYDPEHAGRLPVVGGVEVNQAHGGVVFLLLTAGANLLARGGLPPDGP